MPRREKLSLPENSAQLPQARSEQEFLEIFWRLAESMGYRGAHSRTVGEVQL